MRSRLTKIYCLLSLFCGLFYLSRGEKCGPLGFHAVELLKPGPWYFNLPQSHCPPDLLQEKCSIPASNSSTETYCRIYMNLCGNMQYHCTGSVCAYYFGSSYFEARLGLAVPEPFTEGKDQFHVSYVSEKLPCTGGLKVSTVNIKFVCDQNATWTVNDTAPHQESLAPNPISAKFDCDKCQYNVVFNYSGACFKLPPGESPQQPISMGSIALILFFPGVVLYFIIGVLVNRMRGRTGKESIPHVQFWQDLPELIMDGFVFTMSVITCRQEDGKMNYDTM